MPQHRTKTTFTKGDPRTKRGGRKPLPLDIVLLCRAVTKEAVEKQISILRLEHGGDPQIMSVQHRIADSLLDRGWGPPDQGIKLAADEAITKVIMQVLGPKRDNG